MLDLEGTAGAFQPLFSSIALAIGLLLFSSAVANGFTDNASAARAYGAVPVGPGTYAAKAQRREMALAMEQYWSAFDKSLPRLSPNEMEWLEGELDTSDTLRLTRAINTREYAPYRLGMLADGCTAASATVVLAVNLPAELQTEPLLWTRLASCYFESTNTISSYLIIAELDLDGPFGDGYQLDGLILRQLLNIVIPSALEDAMG